MVHCYLLEVCSFLMKDRKGMDLDGRRVGEKWEKRVEKLYQGIIYEKRMYFHLKQKKKKLKCNGNSVGGLSVSVLFSLVNKETALVLLIGQNLGRQGKLNGMLGERRQSQRGAIDPLETDAENFTR